MNFAKLVPFSLCLVSLPLFAEAAPVDASAQPEVRLAARQHGPIRIKERRDDGTATSTNWSGYAVTAGKDTVTSATASWIVPKATCSGSGPATGYAAFWVGIDGYNSSSVEQTGTDSDCSRGSAVYYAWYEFYPSPSYEITSLTVKPGDVMSASVTYSGSKFTVTITDKTTGKSYSKSQSVSAAKRSSAEWIAEAPSSNQGVLPLSDFGTVFFGYDSTGVTNTCDATISSSTKPIGGFAAADVIAITMESESGSTEAKPSALSSDGSSFSVQWY